ncbi:MAG: deoxyribose-phosphate aldolase [Candidatus Eisenbacteria bacterium]|nr:deoxyribose-phosphate aldolase [Candidatus Eisenbacteria bacterium]
MKIAIGADHAGFELKEELRAHLASLGHEVCDVGTSSDEAVDYPQFALSVANLVSKGSCDRGIVIDGAGIGSAMVANKVRGVRAAAAYDLSTARNSREHNDSNVLTLGAGLTGAALAEQIVELWLTTECTVARHLRRVAQIERIEAGDPAGDAGASLFGNPATPGASGAAPMPRDAADLSEEDLDRIARQLAELLPTAAPAGGAASAAAEGESPSRAEGAPRPPAVGQRPEIARRYLDFGVARLSADPESGAIPRGVAGSIDHTLLKPDATPDQIRRLCDEARENGFAAVCVNPLWVRLAAERLHGTRVAVCSVVGFPLGATPSQIKAFEARRAIRDGAREIDMVIPIGALKAGDDRLVLEDIRAVVEACRDGGARCKVIIEASLLSDEEKRRACRLAKRARAHFVKTSTGFAAGGATAHDVALMAAEVRGAGLEVKAAGGIRSLSDARQMIEAGATRIGASASLAIVEEAQHASEPAPTAPGEKEKSRG